MSDADNLASIKNPYDRGKSKLIADFMLQGRSNEQILQSIKENKLDNHYATLVDMDDIYKVRTRLRKEGKLKEQTISTETEVKDIHLPGLESLLEKSTEKLPEEEGSNKTPKTEVKSLNRRPDWDVLSTEQINSIPDPKLKMDILNYKTMVTQFKQELKPEFATRGEIDLLRTEVVGKFGGIEEKINQLLKKLEDPKLEEPEDTEEEDEEGEEETIYPNVVSAKNPLSEQETVKKTTSKAGENLVEVEKGVIISKLIGFTTKSLMWYELDKTDGLLPNGEAFPGNLADYVNSCIEDVHVSRNIGLSITQRRSVK